MCENDRSSTNSEKKFVKNFHQKLIRLRIIAGRNLFKNTFLFKFRPRKKKKVILSSKDNQMFSPQIYLCSNCPFNSIVAIKHTKSIGRGVRK